VDSIRASTGIATGGFGSSVLTTSDVLTGSGAIASIGAISDLSSSLTASACVAVTSTAKVVDALWRAGAFSTGSGM
jgi:hypothetical protein